MVHSLHLRTTTTQLLLPDIKNRLIWIFAGIYLLNHGIAFTIDCSIGNLCLGGKATRTLRVNFQPQLPILSAQGVFFAYTYTHGILSHNTYAHSRKRFSRACYNSTQILMRHIPRERSQISTHILVHSCDLDAYSYRLPC